MILRRSRTVLAVPCLMTLGLLPGAAASASAAAATEHGGGLIVYSDGDSLRTMHGDGSHNVRIKLKSGGWDEPVWSPDGTQLAATNHGIFTMHADGTAVKGLTNGQDESPSWSPNARHIVFDRRRGHEGDWAVYRVKADGSGLVRLTAWSAEDLQPAWSPDGSKIAYLDQRDNSIDLMNPDGSGQTRIANTPPDVTGPDWSPDGTQLVFSGGDNGCGDIYTIHVDGSALTRLTSYCDAAAGSGSYRADLHPSWSPDGSAIAFERYRKHESAIFQMASDGSGSTRLTGWSKWALSPAWGREVPWCGGHSATIVGTDGDDTINGGPGADVIAGGRGDDTISGHGGDDIICGGIGRDAIFGNTGDDDLFGGHGRDHLSGGHGNDVIHGGPGRDVLHGDDGADHLYGDAGNDSLHGNEGNDVLYGGSGADSPLSGGRGVDDVHQGSPPQPSN